MIVATVSSKGRGMDLRADGGDLDGDALDAGVPQIGDIGGHVGACLLLAEDLLPQAVDVDPEPLRPPLREVGAERLPLPGNDEVAAVRAHLGHDPRDGQPGHEIPEEQKQADQPLFEGRKETGDPFGQEDLSDLIGCAPHVAGAETAVDQGGEGRLVGGA